MTADQLRRALGSPPRPAAIWQEPFDYDPKHYPRLCASVEGNRPPDPIDLYDYAEDLSFQDEIQPELLVYLLPLCLQAVSMDLLGETGSYGGFCEQFWVGLNRRPGPLALLSAGQTRAVEGYLREAILAAIDSGRRLPSAGMGAACYRWFSAIGSFATVFAGLAELWSSWWKLDSEGRAIGALQYLSVLMYEVNANPVFAPWTRTEGGGPPLLWEDSMAVNQQPWHPQNVAFLGGALQPDSLFAAIDGCRERLTHEEDRRIAARMRQDLPRQRTLVELRIGQLLATLSRDHYMIHEWTV